MSSPIFCVFDEPYCLQDFDIKNRNLEFINGIDTGYYEYILNNFIESDDDKRSSIILRSTLHHATETMFTLMGAYIQAHDCCYAWVAKCSNITLRNLVKDIKTGGKFIKPKIIKLNDNINFKSISECIYDSSVFPQRENDKTVQLFAKFWSRLANEFLDEFNIDEYNSIKHGFRIKSGGFTLRAGIQKEPGVEPLAKDINTIGHSEYGTTYFKINRNPNIKGNRTITSKRTSLNWRFEKIVGLLQLVSFSINNITEALKVINGTIPSECKFVRPENDDDFLNPWTYLTGVTHSTMDVHIPENEIYPTKKVDLLKIFKNEKC